jgi:hypothetical protein
MQETSENAQKQRRKCIPESINHKMRQSTLNQVHLSRSTSVDTMYTGQGPSQAKAVASRPSQGAPAHVVRPHHPCCLSGRPRSGDSFELPRGGFRRYLPSVPRQTDLRRLFKDGHTPLSFNQSTNHSLQALAIHKGVDPSYALATPTSSCYLSPSLVD